MVQHHRPDQPKTQQANTAGVLTSSLDNVELEQLPAVCSNNSLMISTPKRRLHGARIAEKVAGVRRRPPYLQLKPAGRSTLRQGFLNNLPSTDTFSPAALAAAGRIGGRNSHDNLYSLPSPCSMLKSGGRGGNDNGPHNTVDIERIRLGLDVRSTVSCTDPLNLLILIGILDHGSQHSE